MITIGVFGAGHLGKIHLKCLNQLPEQFRLAGFFDPDEEVRAHVEKEFGVKGYQDAETLIANVDALDVVAPTPAHYDLIMAGLEAGKHVFTEKPGTESVSQARAIRDKVYSSGLKLQVGHVGRFNTRL